MCEREGERKRGRGRERERVREIERDWERDRNRNRERGKGDGEGYFDKIERMFIAICKFANIILAKNLMYTKTRSQNDESQ